MTGVLDFDPTDIQSLENAAIRGIAEAQNLLGMRYEIGEDVDLDLSKAIDWYRFSIENGCDAAKSNLANLYATGTGIPQNTAQAFKLYQEVLCGDQIGDVETRFVKEALNKIVSGMNITIDSTDGPSLNFPDGSSVRFTLGDVRSSLAIKTL